MPRRVRIRRKPEPVAPKPTSSRYTAPKPKTTQKSPMWLPAAMFTCLGAGVVVIISNYLELLPGGSAQNNYLFLGLGLMIAGFVLSTGYR